MGEDDISVVFAKFCDAVARYDVDAAGRLVSEHLGAFVLHDLEGTRVALAGLDIRSALRYPAVAVLHPRQHELARFFPKKSQLPWFSRGVADDVTLRPMYLMAFLREAGRVKLAGRYADQVVEGLLVPTAPRRRLPRRRRRRVADLVPGRAHQACGGRAATGAWRSHNGARIRAQ